jgi:putative two-component system response regulator
MTEQETIHTDSLYWFDANGSAVMAETNLSHTPRILIIDDDELIHHSIEAILGREGYHLTFASSGVEGISAAVAIRPDVVLLDIMMPVMNGYAVCEKLRNLPAVNEVPILFLTALDDQASRLRGLDVGADDFLSKPVNSLELRARLRTITRLDRYRKLYSERERLVRAMQDLEQSHHHLQQAYNETLSGWARAVDLRDQETVGHSQRVRAATIKLATALGMPDSEILQASRGALLHDLGKIAIPDEILFKPGPLNDAEWAIMRKHPVFAYEMLKPIEYLRPALDIPYCHHEKWDGSGYPRGLAGEAIPFSARIFAIIDVWDALLSDRPYRKAMPVEQVLEYIRSQSGTHFDPQIVQVFLDIFAPAASK